MAVITGFQAGFHLLLADAVDALLTAITVVCLVLVQQLLNDFCVATKPLCLVKRALVVIQTKPFHAIQDGPDGFRRRAFQVGVLDAQDEFAAMVPGENHVK